MTRGGEGAACARCEVAQRFGENLARHRRRAGLSQEEVAFRASLHRTEISMLENGRRLARIDTLVKLARAVEVSVEELLGGIEWVPPHRAPRGALWVSPAWPPRPGASPPRRVSAR